MCVFVCSSLITLHRFHFCICNMKISKSVLDTSGRQKCCLCLCTFCSLASVPGPPGPSAPLIRTWAFPGLTALSSTEEWQVPRVTRMTLPVYCHYTVTSLPNYTNLHQHTQEQALRSEILGQIKGERPKKRSTFWGGEANKWRGRQRACLDMSHWSKWKKSWPDRCRTRSNYPFQTLGWQLTKMQWLKATASVWIWVSVHTETVSLLFTGNSRQRGWQRPQAPAVQHVNVPITLPNLTHHGTGEWCPKESRLCSRCTNKVSVS